MAATEETEDTVFQTGQKVHVYDECENYIGFDGVIDYMVAERNGVEFYKVKMENGEELELSEMRLADFQPTKADPLQPSSALIVKLGSIARHVQELKGPNSDPLDASAIEGLLVDPEVVEWMAAMDERGLLPVPR